MASSSIVDWSYDPIAGVIDIKFFKSELIQIPVSEAEAVQIASNDALAARLAANEVKALQDNRAARSGSK